MKQPLAAALAVLALSACGGSQKPVTTPAPARPPVVETAMVVSDDTIPTPPARPAPKPRPADSVRVSPTDVKRGAVQVFGDSAAPGPTAAPADSLEVDGEAVPVWDIDVRSYETQARVAHFVNMFSGPARDRIQLRLERGSRYEPMIRAKFRAGGIPEDMYYLALIESGYDPNAYSRAAAVGMWQFMSSTAKGLGLRVDWWVDERRDPARSTDGAIKFIRYLRDQFGSLYLAAAAYNGGPGRIARGLSRYADGMEDLTGDDRFFALAEENYLPRETKDYVPQLIAVALVAKDPARYGIQVRPAPPFVYDSVRVQPSTPIAAAAKAAGVTVASVRELNPHVLRGVTPPTGPFWLRVPPGTAEGFDSAYAELPAAERKAFTRVVSKKGQSLGSIAVKHDLTARELAWYNPKVSVLRPSGRLRPGQTILVPSRAVASAATDVPDPSIERYGSSARGRMVTHVVRRGESLSTIAKKYRTNVSTLKRLNGLRRTTIFPGQTIVVRGGTSKARSSSRSSARSSSKAKARPGKSKTTAGKGTTSKTRKKSGG